MTEHRKNRGESPVPDVKTIQRLQEQYSKAVLARGLPPEIKAKLARMQELYAEALSGEPNFEQLQEAFEAAAEVAAYTNFKVDDVDWNAPDVQRRLARGEMVWRERPLWEESEEK